MNASMHSNNPAPSRNETAARKVVLRRIKEQHREFRTVWREFSRINLAQDGARADALVQRFCNDLRSHGRFEHAHLYPALRAISDDARATQRADIEHQSLEALLDRLQALHCGDEAFAALLEVACEHAVQHIRHEESLLLPQLERAPVDWLGLVALLEQTDQQPAPPAASAAPEQSAPEVPEAARPVPPAASGEQVPVVHSSPVPLAEPADDTLPPDAVRSRPDTPAERRAARRSAPIK